MKFESKSKEGQDTLVNRLLGDRGFFLDVGCDWPIRNNNTYALEEVGWEGLLFDKNREPSLFECRKSEYLEVDVTTAEFTSILNEKSPKEVDYISLDVDENSIAALNAILNNGIKFKIMTFEHDFYKCGEERRKPSRDLLFAAGYDILFRDVKSRNRNGSGFRIWEDWWVDPNFFSEDLLSIRREGIFWKNCIDLVGKSHFFPRDETLKNVDDILCLK